ncbi:hypothetical protein G3I62_01780 [Streptomyces sp. SID14446]|nr:hypothetical protein [Streptomyces sp. SID14446]
MATHAPQTFDPTRVPHLSGRFAPVTEEVDETGLEVTGELPAELDGLFLRNGPNPRFSPIGSFLYASGPTLVSARSVRSSMPRARHSANTGTPALRGTSHTLCACEGAVGSGARAGPISGMTTASISASLAVPSTIRSAAAREGATWAAWRSLPVCR